MIDNGIIQHGVEVFQQIFVDRTGRIVNYRRVYDNWNRKQVMEITFLKFNNGTVTPPTDHFTIPVNCKPLDH